MAHQYRHSPQLFVIVTKKFVWQKCGANQLKQNAGSSYQMIVVAVIKLVNGATGGEFDICKIRQKRASPFIRLYILYSA